MLAVLFVSRLVMPLLLGTTLFEHPKRSHHIEQEVPLAVNKCIPGPEAGRVQGVHMYTVGIFTAMVSCSGLVRQNVSTTTT